MFARPRHPNKEIEKAIQEAESNGWYYKPSGNSAHAWGRLYCPLNNREGCMMSIWSTPKSANNHANQIRQKIKQCCHLRST